MPAEADLFYPNKPYLLTLKGQVTVHFLDGQTLTGEVTAQDTFNVFLTVEGAPHLISRTQIRYIKGEPGQAIEADITSTSLPVVPPPSPVTPPEPEPVAEVAYFVEDEEAAPAEEDLGGTLVIPPAAPTSADTGLHQPATNELEESGKTIILAPEAETVLEVAPSAPVSPEEVKQVASLELDEDATFVLSQDEEISAHLVCTTGPHAGEVFQLRLGITTIGRSGDNTVPLSRDKEVSRRHAIIAYEASQFVVQDQNSLNGTFVNNQPVKEPHPLEDGDILLIGVSTLKFQERS